MQPEKNGKPLNDCFVLMPIADPEGYEKGHFKKVYDDIFKVACEKAGLNPVRADDVKETNLIHLDILQKLIESPMAICDLSSRNPNVLFELGLRQAFDKPTVIVQEIGTPRIFDISPMRYTEYRKELKYREVLEDQNFIAEALTETQKATSSGKGVNSLIQLLSLTNPAKLKEGSGDDTAKMLQVVMSEMNDLRADFSRVTGELKTIRGRRGTIKLAESISIDPEIEFDDYHYRFLDFQNKIASNMPLDLVSKAYTELQKISASIRNDMPRSMVDRIFRAQSEADVMYSNYISGPKN
jgi:hypothetical protein